MGLAPRILVAGDDQALSRTLSWILRENGYAVVAIPGGDQLLEYLAGEQFDLLLLDIAFPGDEGFDLLRRLAVDPEHRALPVLAISPIPHDEAAARIPELTAGDFIPRPFRVRELLARVKGRLRQGRELNQARTEARSRSEMLEILEEVASTLRPDEIFQVLVRRVAQGLRISRCSIILAQPGDTEGVVVAACENPTLRDLRVDLSRYPELTHALRTGETVFVADVATDPLYEEVRDAWAAEGRPIPTRSTIALRFLIRGRPAGVFFLRTTEADVALNQQDLAFAGQVITAAVASLERAYDLEVAAGAAASRAPGDAEPRPL